MRVSDAKLAEIWDNGFTVVEGFLDPDTLAAAQAALWAIYPKPEDYFADPDKHPRYARSQFHGVRPFPTPEWAINRVAVYPDLIDAAERFCGAKEIDIYKAEVWAKYAGAVDYDQAHHRDFGNHSLVVPRKDGGRPQMTTFILFSDITEADGPTKFVPLKEGLEVPLNPRYQPMGALTKNEVSATGPAGSLLIYKTDVLHRGSDFKGAGRSRFLMLVDFKQRGSPWNGMMCWPGHGNMDGMSEAMIRMTSRERDLFGWPPAGSDYWNAQTLADVADRYPGIDLTPYEPVGVEQANG